MKYGLKINWALFICLKETFDLSGRASSHCQHPQILPGIVDKKAESTSDPGPHLVEAEGAGETQFLPYIQLFRLLK